VSQTAYQNTYLPSGKLAQAKATKPAAPKPLSQGYQLDYVFNGIGNLEKATEVVSWPTSSGTASTYQPVKVTAGEAKDKLATIEHAASGAGPAAPPAAVRTVYGYDLQGHVLTVSRNGTEAERLTYGPTGELVSRQVGGKFTFYVGEYMSITASGQAGCSGAGCVPQPGTVEVDDHVLLAGTRIVSVRPSRTLYYYRSRLGTVVATSTAGGVLGAQYRFDPYGKVQVALNETATTASELGYTNGLRLSGSLIYLKARVYDAEARVFLQADSVDRYRYAYVWGDPVNLSDPTGLRPPISQSMTTGFKSLDDLFAVAAQWIAARQATSSDKKTTDPKPPPDPATSDEKAPGRGTGMQAEGDPAQKTGPSGSSTDRDPQSGVYGGGVSGALALGVGIQVDVQWLTDGNDSGLMISAGARAGWNVAAGVNPTVFVAPGVPSLKEYLGGDDPTTPSIQFTPSAGLGVVVAVASVSRIEYQQICGEDAGTRYEVAHPVTIDLPGPGFDVGPYLSGSVGGYLPTTSFWGAYAQFLTTKPIVN
jgi:RHS repeat-associated protein